MSRLLNKTQTHPKFENSGLTIKMSDTKALNSSSTDHVAHLERFNKFKVTNTMSNIAV